MFDIFELFSTLKGHIKKRDVIWLGVITLLFLLTRLINLDKFPIFSDEGIYIHWAKEAWHDASLRFISLTDGKQPLQTWGTIPFLKLFADNMLLGGRLYAVMNGFLCLIGIGVLANYLFGKKAAIWGMLFYIFTPYFLFHDRLALVDSGVNAATVWILFFSIWLAQTRSLDTAFLFGVVAGVGLLAKSSVRIFLGLSVLAPVFFLQKKYTRFFKSTINYLVVFSISVIIALVIYNVQRLSPYMHLVSQKNMTFVMTFSDFIHTPFKYFLRNIQLIPWYVFQESAFVLPVLGITGLVMLYSSQKKLAAYVTLWILLPFFIVSFLSIVLYPRYIIFFPTFFSITAAYLFAKLKNRQIVLVCAALYFISVSYFDYTILFNFKQIPLVPIDRAQYLEDWSAGWGVKSIVEYARQKSQEKPVILLAEGNFGMASDSLDSMLKSADAGKIAIWGRWPLNDTDIEQARKEIPKNHVYIVLSQSKPALTTWRAKLIHEYIKPGNTSTVYLLELLP